MWRGRQNSWKGILLNRFLSLFLLLVVSSAAYAADGGDSEAGAVCCGTVIFIFIAIAVRKAATKSDGQLNNQTESGDWQNAADSSDLPHYTPPVPQGYQTGFYMTVLPRIKDMGSGDMQCLTVLITGAINMPPNMLTAVFNLYIWDVTLGQEEDKRKPVLCSLPELQMAGSQMFMWTHMMQMPYANSVMNTWTEILSVPVDLLTFPARGERKLLFAFSIAPLGMIQSPIATATFKYSYKNDSLGYVDGIRMRIKAEELGLKYAAAVGAVDGSLDDVEKTLVRNWMDTRIESLPENLRADTTRSLSRALMIAERLGTSIKPDEIEMLCEDMANEYPIGSFSKGDLYDIVELCMNVAAADGIAGPEELNLVNRIALLLGVDPERAKQLSEKILPVNMHSEKDINSILGLRSDWTLKQTKKHLREQYREWSARVTHSDAKVRDQADEMLRLIALKRAEIDAES
jgi:hypothetical protein